MLADGLTKALPRQHHEEFMRMINLEDITDRIQREKRMEILQDKIKDLWTEKTAPEVVLLAYKGVKTGRNLKGYRDLAPHLN